MPLYNKSERWDVLLALALRLISGKGVTTRYIRERFGVSRPTAQRMLLTLETTMPVIAIRGTCPRRFVEIELRIQNPQLLERLLAEAQ